MRVRLLVAYDGSQFSGFAQNRDVRTVAGVLTSALSRALSHEVVLTCAGRTDAGVHAWGQVVTFDGPDGIDLVALQRSLNRMLGPEVVVRSATPASVSFDARRSATSRRYRYTVLNRPEPDPFLARTSWHVPDPLDVRAMRLGCDPLIGEHDFASFCRRPRVDPGVVQPSLVRRVLDARWSEQGDDLLRFEIEATSFCHQMVRSIVGLLVSVGLGRRRAGNVMGVLQSRDRASGANLAPPHGLVLWTVSYGDHTERV